MRGRARWVVAVLLAVLIAPAPARAQEEASSPLTPEETARLEALLPCPAVTGTELVQTSLRFDEFYTRTCVYRDGGGISQVVSVSWLAADHTGYAGWQCRPEVGRDDQGAGFIRVTLGHAEGTRATSGSVELNNATADLEAALVAVGEGFIATIAPEARGCAAAAATVDCPEVAGYTAEQPDPGDLGIDGYSLSCFYDNSAINASFIVSAWYIPQGGVPSALESVCTRPAQIGTGFGVVRGTAAVLATYAVTSHPTGPERSVLDAAATAFVASLEPSARGCEGFVVDADGGFEALPPQFAAVFTEEAIAAPAVLGGGTAPVSESGGGSGGGSGLLRMVSLVLTALSVLGLLLAFALIKRETRVHLARDVVRVVIGATVVVGTIVILKRSTPVWALAAAAVVGGALGYWQGMGLVVRRTERGLMAKRNLWGMAAFAAGIVVMQVAGLIQRSGAVVFGVALSVLSIAITVGLIVGRSPAMRRATTSAVRLILPLALFAGVLAGFGVAVGSAQTDPTPEGTCRRDGFLLAVEECAGYQHLLDVVPWDQALVTGGLYWDEGKPPAPLTVPRALAAPPDPVTRTIAWETTDDVGTTAYEVTETYTFMLRAGGECCGIHYEGAGAATTTAGDGSTRTDTREVAGRLYDVTPLGRHLLGSSYPEGIPFSEATEIRGQPESCVRVIAENRGEDDPEAGEWTVNRRNGEDIGSGAAAGFLAVGCDLPLFSYEQAFAVAPPVPAADSALRTGACPVRQEVYRFLAPASFPGVSTETLGSLFLEPNAPACSLGALFSPLQFGPGERGATRHEVFLWMAEADPAARARDRASDEDSFFSLFRLSDIPVEERCAVGADGIPLQPADGSPCEYITAHRLPTATEVQGFRQTVDVLDLSNAAQVIISTDWDTDDGPNVTVDALLPWGRFQHRCHHCTPGSPEITAFIAAVNAAGSTRGTGEVAEPVPGDEPGETPATTDDDDLSAEDAALIAFIGLIGTVGLVGTALPEGATLSDLLAARRGGDLDALAGGPPAPLDEHGNPMTVNRGEWPDVPVGHVWWGTGDGTSRWVSPDEAATLVDQARNAEAAKAADQAELLAAHDRHADADWETLKQRTRAEAIKAWGDRAAAAEDSRIRIEDSDAIRDLAEAGGHQDIIDYLQRHPVPGPDEIAALYDALNRRAGDQAVLDALGEVDVVRETLKGSQADLAAALDAIGQPGLGWVVRHPGLVGRVGAAVATGGWSEMVAVPIDIVTTMQAAQAKSLAENGRMMTSGELFGELGWALGTEAVYEAGGHLVAGGLGRLAGSADEVAEAGMRQADEVAETAARRGDDLIPLPPKGNEGLRTLTPGQPIPPGMVDQTGLTREHLDRLADYARREQLQVSARTTNPYSARHIADGTAIPKPLEIKAKTVGDIDVLLGANPDHRGTVGLFEPTMPSSASLDRMTPELRQAVESRYSSRLKEYTENLTTYQNLPNTRVQGGQVQTLVDGQWKNYAGDMDLVHIRDAAGNRISGPRYDEIVADMRRQGLIEHGGEVRVISDVTANYPPGSPEWMEAMRKASNLRESLENAHLTGEEVIVTMTPDGTLVRGEELDELLWW